MLRAAREESQRCVDRVFQRIDRPTKTSSVIPVMTDGGRLTPEQTLTRVSAVGKGAATAGVDTLAVPTANAAAAVPSNQRRRVDVLGLAALSCGGKSFLLKNALDTGLSPHTQYRVSGDLVRMDNQALCLVNDAKSLISCLLAYTSISFCTCAVDQFDVSDVLRGDPTVLTGPFRRESRFLGETRKMTDNILIQCMPEKRSATT